MSVPIFRKVSLERLSSPEQLDLLMPVTGGLSWVALLSGILLLGVITFWGFNGEIQERVVGQGILLKKESLHDVVSRGTGRIEKLLVKVDDEITEGQLLAVLSQPELEDEIREVENQLQLLEIERAQTQSYGDQSQRVKFDNIAEQRRSYEEAIKADERRLASLEQQLEGRRKLMSQGLMTLIQVQEISDEYDSVLQHIRELKTQFGNLNAQEIDVVSQKDKEMTSVQARISQEKQRLRGIKENLELRSNILSTQTGKVLELYGAVGRVVQTGEPLLTVEVSTPDSESLSAVLYFPSADGKKIRQSMEAQISPSVAKPEEYGSMLAKVTQVSAFPASGKGMMRVLQNEELVQQLLSGGTPIMVYASLIPEERNFSGYKWSSGAGPSLQIQSGTLCGVGVVVQRQRPIDLVVPYLKRKVLGQGEDVVTDAAK